LTRALQNSVRVSADYSAHCESATTDDLTEIDAAETIQFAKKNRGRKKGLLQTKLENLIGKSVLY